MVSHRYVQVLLFRRFDIGESEGSRRQLSWTPASRSRSQSSPGHAYPLQWRIFLPTRLFSSTLHLRKEGKALSDSWEAAIFAVGGQSPFGWHLSWTQSQSSPMGTSPLYLNKWCRSWSCQLQEDWIYLTKLDLHIWTCVVLFRSDDMKRNFAGWPYQILAYLHHFSIFNFHGDRFVFCEWRWHQLTVTA